MKILLAKLGLDVHDKGVLMVKAMLEQAGHEVKYIGNANPFAVFKWASVEEADMIGVSILSGAHKELGLELVNLMRWANMLKHVVCVVGGVIAQEDVPVLLDMGFDRVFVSGSSRPEIIAGIEESFRNKRRG